MAPKIIFELKDWSEPSEWGYNGPDAETLFEGLVKDYDGDEIVELELECSGYYNIKFADGHELSAVSGFHISVTH